MNAPHGATVIWPPLFDLLLATLCAALGLGPQDAEAVEKVTSFVVPVLGALTVVALYGLAQRIFGRTHALLACAVLATLPAHVWYSRLGFVDHHVAVTLVQVLLFHSLLRALAAGSEPDAPLRAAMPWTAAAAACLTVGFLVWNGFLFFAFLLDLCLLALLLLERNDPRSSVWRFALVTHVAAAILITPFVIATVRVSGRAFSPLTLSWLPVAALLAFGLLGGLDGLRRSALLASWPPWLRWTLLAAPVAGIAAILVHQSRNLTLGFQWLTASDRFMASVAESGSSLFTSGVFNLEQPQIWLTRFYLAAPVPLALLGLDLHRRGWRDRDRTVILIWGTALFAMSIVQRRFGEPFAPVLALLAADLLMRVHGWVARLLRPEDAPESRAPREDGKKAGTAADAWSEGASQAAAWVAVAATVVLAYLPSAPGFFLALRKDGDYSRQTFEDLKRFAAVLEGRFGPGRPGRAAAAGDAGPLGHGPPHPLHHGLAGGGEQLRAAHRGGFVPGARELLPGDRRGAGRGGPGPAEGLVRAHRLGAELRAAAGRAPRRRPEAVLHAPPRAGSRHHDDAGVHPDPLFPDGEQLRGVAGAGELPGRPGRPHRRPGAVPPRPGDLRGAAPPPAAHLRARAGRPPPGHGRSGRPCSGCATPSARPRGRSSCTGGRSPSRAAPRRSGCRIPRSGRSTATPRAT